MPPSFVNYLSDCTLNESLQLINARKALPNFHYRFKRPNYYYVIVIHTFLLFIPLCTNTFIHPFSPLPQKSFFRTSVYLFSSFFFYSEMKPDERTLLCKAIFNPFWRPFSLSFFESFVPHLASHPHPFHFDFTASPFPCFFAVFVSSSLDGLSSNPVSSKLCRILVRR